MPCRFLRDDDTVSVIRWVEAEDGAPIIDKVTAINSQVWERWYEVDAPSVGELPGRIKFIESFAPPGLVSDHVCGTDEDFEVGGQYLPDEPEVKYAADGFPECCDPPRVVRGGVGVSGRALVSFSPNPVRGGVGVSGRAVVSRDLVTVRGGVGVSGRAVTSVDPPAIMGRGGVGISGAAFVAVSGDDCVEGDGHCDSAPLSALDNWCPIDNDTELAQYKRYAIVVGHTYRFELVWEFGVEQIWQLFTGLVCASPVVLLDGVSHTTPVSFDWVATYSTVWFKVLSPVGPVDFGWVRIRELP